MSGIAEAQQRRAGLADRGEEDRRQEHEADLKEHRQADQESRQEHRPIQPLLAQRADEHPRHDQRSTRLGKQLADDACRGRPPSR